MSRARELSQLANENALSVNDTTYEVGINSTSPDADLNVGGTIKMDGTAGVITATTYVGAVTGNVTGNCSGSAGSATGNAATATLATNASGLSGTPSIVVQDIIAVGATFSGVLTYEDVTQIDSVGLITARSGVAYGTGIGATISSPATNNLALGTNGAERLRIDSSGNVGVAVTNPSSFNSDGRNLVVGSGSGGQGISIYSATNNYGSIYFADGLSGSELYRGAVLYNHSSDYLRLDTAGGERARITSTGGISLKNGFLQENWYNAGSAWSTDGEVNLDNGMVQYNSNNLAGTNNTIDLVTTAGIKTDMVNGSICAVTLITAVSASTAYINHVTIDQIAQTESWIGGSAPTAGGSSGFDTYTFNIMRWGTGNTDFTIIANHVKTS